MKSKKLLKKAAALLAVVAMFVSVNIMDVGAVSSINTGNYYMNGYRLYGSLTEYPNHAQGYTYCENKSAGKIAHTIYSYRDEDGAIYSKTAGSTDYTYNGEYSLSVRTDNADPSLFYLFVGAWTQSEVIYPNATYYHWTSEGTDIELRMGIYER